MALPGVLQHVCVLEPAGLVPTGKEGRVRRCRLETEGLAEPNAWISLYQQASRRPVSAGQQFIYTERARGCALVAC